MISFPGFVRASGRVQNDHPSQKMFLIPKEVAGINALIMTQQLEASSGSKHLQVYFLSNW